MTLPVFLRFSASSERYWAVLDSSMMFWLCTGKRRAKPEFYQSFCPSIIPVFLLNERPSFYKNEPVLRIGYTANHIFHGGVHEGLPLIFCWKVGFMKHTIKYKTLYSCVDCYCRSTRLYWPLQILQSTDAGISRFTQPTKAPIVFSQDPREIFKNENT